MSRGYSQEEATKKAYAKFGEGYFEHQERVTVDQNERLYIMQNPPEIGGSILEMLGLISIAFGGIARFGTSTLERLSSTGKCDPCKVAKATAISATIAVAAMVI